MNNILIVAKDLIEVAATDCVGLIEEGHNYIITGDFGYIGSVATRKEAFEIANEYAQSANAEVMIEE
jgi:hypothetical protein